MSKKDEWITAREAAERVGRQEAAIRRWYSTGQIRSKRDGRRIFVSASDIADVVRRINDKPQGRKPKKGAGKKPRRAESEMARHEFAQRLGLNERTVAKMRREGKIERYTQTELDKLLQRQSGASQDANDFDPTTATLKDLANASLEDMKKFKMYHDARRAAVAADRDEGKVYSAGEVEALVRRLAHAAKASWQQASMILPARLAGKEMAEIREALAYYAQQQIESLVAVAESIVEEA